MGKKFKRAAVEVLGSKKLYIYILTAVIAFAAAFAVLSLVKPKRYSIKTSFAITDSSAANKSVTDKLAMGENYVWLFNEIFKFDTIYEKTAQQLDYAFTASELKSMIRTETVENTAIIDIYATAPSPEIAGEITSIFTSIAVNYTKENMPIDKINIIVLRNPNEAVSENNNIVFSVLLAIIVSALIFVIHIAFLLMRNSVESTKDLRINFDILVLGILPSKLNKEIVQNEK